MKFQLKRLIYFIYCLFFMFQESDGKEEEIDWGDVGVDENINYVSEYFSVFN